MVCMELNMNVRGRRTAEIEYLDSQWLSCVQVIVNPDQWLIRGGKISNRNSSVGISRQGFSALLESRLVIVFALLLMNIIVSPKFQLGLKVPCPLCLYVRLLVHATPNVHRSGKR